MYLLMSITQQESELHKDKNWDFSLSVPSTVPVFEQAVHIGCDFSL